jgi:hypothetical protein
MDFISEARLRLLARRIHRLGERPLFELFRELDDGTDLSSTLEAYAKLPADLIREYGGDRLPAIRIVGGVR